ncbi:MAG: hypothetical protein ACFCUI_10680, partial [Bernardetiaceae bacterium]
PEAESSWDGFFTESDGWDGTLNEKALPAGTYLYTIVWTGRDAKTGKPIKEEINGLVYLIRGAE